MVKEVLSQEGLIFNMSDQILYVTSYAAMFHIFRSKALSGGVITRNMIGWLAQFILCFSLGSSWIRCSYKLHT